MSISSDIAKAVKRLYPDQCKVIKIKMLYTKEVYIYVMRIEEGNKKAAKSKLRF